MFPTEVPIDEKTLLKLTQIYLKAKEQIVSEFEGATDFGIANRRSLLAQIDVILESLGAEGVQIIKDEVVKQYQKGSEQAIGQLESLGQEVNIPTAFNNIHQDAIQALVSDTAKPFAESMDGIKRQATTLINRNAKQQITDQLALGKISGKALREVKRNVVAVLKSDGLTALVDKGGRSWELDRYAEMLIRTKAVEARNTGLSNRMAQNGYDLVQVSSHGATDQCAEWEGAILSLTGNTPGYKTVEQAREGGLFHPNCRHAINVYIPDLANRTSAFV